MSDIIVGVDVGGTTSKIGLLNRNGKIISKWEIPTTKGKDGDTLVKDIWHSVQATLAGDSHSVIKGIGVGAPGFIDGATGLIYEAVNIGWINFPLAERFSHLTGLPVFIENDANIAALGENWVGAGNLADNLIAVTVGTGVGGGIITNGRILDGENGMAGEIGHATVDPDGYPCNCGRYGCLETIASATGIVRQVSILADENPESELSSFIAQSGSVTSKDVFALAAGGDLLCQSIINRIGDVLGFTLANLSMAVNPSKILIGGGVSKAGDQLINVIDRSFRQYVHPRVSKVCDIKTAQLGNDAGIIGAAYLVEQHLQKQQ